MIEDIKKNKTEKQDAPFVAINKSAVTEKPKREKYSPKQKGKIKKIKNYLKETGKKSTNDVELGVVTLKTEA